MCVRERERVCVLCVSVSVHVRVPCTCTCIAERTPEWLDYYCNMLQSWVENDSVTNFNPITAFKALYL